MPYLELIVMSVFAITFYRAGRHERSSAILWSAGSITCSLLALRFIGRGAVGIILGQVVLVIAITVFRMWRDRPGRRD